MLCGRITRPYSDLESVVLKMAFVSDKIIFYEHDKDDKIERTHCHFFTENLKVSTDTVKNWIKQSLNVSSFPKTDWMFKTEYEDRKSKKKIPVDHNCITYFSKGKLDPKFQKGFTQIEINNFKNSFVDYSAVPKTRQSKLNFSEGLSKKEKEKTYWTIVKDVLALCREYRGTGTTDYRQVCGILIEYLSNVEKVVGIYKQADLVDTIMVRLDKVGSSENLREIVARRYGRN